VLRHWQERDGAELVTRTVDQSSCWWRSRLGSVRRFAPQEDWLA
jgi:hypothetical protein